MVGLGQGHWRSTRGNNGMSRRTCAGQQHRHRWIGHQQKIVIFGMGAASAPLRVLSSSRSPAEIISTTTKAAALCIIATDKDTEGETGGCCRADSQQPFLSLKIHLRRRGCSPLNTCVKPSADLYTSFAAPRKVVHHDPLQRWRVS